MPTFWSRTNPETGKTDVLRKPDGLVLKTGDTCCCAPPTICIWADINLTSVKGIYGTKIYEPTTGDRYRHSVTIGTETAYRRIPAGSEDAVHRNFTTSGGCMDVFVAWVANDYTSRVATTSTLSTVSESFVSNRRFSDFSDNSLTLHYSVTTGPLTSLYIDRGVGSEELICGPSSTRTVSISWYFQTYTENSFSWVWRIRR